MYSLTAIVQSGQDFTDSLVNSDVFKALKAAWEFLTGVATFLAAIVAWVGEVCVHVIKLAISGS